MKRVSWYNRSHRSVMKNDGSHRRTTSDDCVSSRVWMFFRPIKKESLILLRHLETQQKLLNLSMENLLSTGAVHRGLKPLNITGYIPAIDFPNSPAKYGVRYDAQKDTFLCPMGQPLIYHRLNCNKSTGKYLRCYQIQDDSCVHYSRKQE